MWLGATALDRAAQDFRGWHWMAACVLAVGEVRHHAGLRQGAALCSPDPNTADREVQLSHHQLPLALTFIQLPLALGETR